MKHQNLFKSSFLAFIAAMLPQMASAYDFMVDGLCYNFNEDGTSVTVTYEGTGYYGYGYSNLIGALNIPETVTYNGAAYSVTSIGDNAFYYCTSLTSATIPNSVTSIGYRAFCVCRGLTSVIIGNSVTAISEKAFSYCSELTSVTIGNSVTAIGEYAFSDCTHLTSVTIPNSVVLIGEGVFSYCSSLTSIIVGGGNTNYDSRGNCNAIIETETNTLICGCMNTIIPNSVTSIEANAFYGCTGLTSVTIPNSVKKIREGAFCDCTNLTTVTISNSVTTINESTFSGCTGLTSITIPYSVNRITKYAFSGCTGLTSVTIPSSVQYIYRDAFNNCSSLNSLSFLGQGSWSSYTSTNFRGLTDIIYKFKTINIGMELSGIPRLHFTPDVINSYAESPPSCFDAFDNYDAELHVPTTSIAAYMDSYWQNFNIVNDLGKVTLDKENANLVQWETLALTATVTNVGDEVKWSSTNSSVAIVNENGIVTATGGGECDIYATLASSHDAAYAKCHITSTYPEITILLSEDSIEMNIGEKNTINATISPDNTGLYPIWTSSDESIAKVTAYGGNVTAIGEGECDIIATVLDQTATCHVTVTNNVTITLNIESALIGASQMLTVYPSCSPDVPVELVVTSSDQSVAVARVINRTNAPAEGVTFFPEKDMALNLIEELAASDGTKSPELTSTKAIMIDGVQNGTTTITVTTADGQATPAVLELRVVDVDGDRTITSTDITCLYNYLLNGDESFIDTSDVDGDGYITSTDITVIYNLLLGN